VRCWPQTNSFLPLSICSARCYHTVPSVPILVKIDQEIINRPTIGGLQHKFVVVDACSRHLQDDIRQTDAAAAAAATEATQLVSSQINWALWSAANNLLWRFCGSSVSNFLNNVSSTRLWQLCRVAETDLQICVLSHTVCSPSYVYLFILHQLNLYIFTNAWPTRQQNDVPVIICLYSDTSYSPREMNVNFLTPSGKRLFNINIFTKDWLVPLQNHQFRQIPTHSA